MRALSSKTLIFFLGIFLTTLYCSCFAYESSQTVPKNLEQIETSKELGNYMANYYKNPHPEEIPKFIDILLGEKGFLNPYNGASWMGFLTRITKDNPEKIREWFAEITPSDLNKLVPVYRAIWNADTQQSREFLTELTNSNDKLLAEIAKAIIMQPPEEDVLDESFLSFGSIDRAWAEYGASGDNRYLKKILMIAVSRNFKEIYADDGLIHMAVWSLNSMRKQDNIVDEKIRSLIADDPKLEYQTDKERSLHSEL